MPFQKQHKNQCCICFENYCTGQKYAYYLKKIEISLGISPFPCNTGTSELTEEPALFFSSGKEGWGEGDEEEEEKTLFFLFYNWLLMNIGGTV